MSILHALALAFLGGMLLNLMPCVLPVLAVKTTSLASMGDASFARRLRHALGYSAGILFSMGILAAVVIGLQQAGQTVGWGFQFQQPLYVAVLAGVMVLFAMNLFGSFEIQVPQFASSVGERGTTEKSRSFFEGILAVVLATPCTAPFMGTAVGFAMTSSPPVIAVTFAALGVGLASPFVVIALFPKFQSLLPSPGPWMGGMKKILGFVLLGTAIWLIWIFGRLSGLDAVTGLLIFLLGSSFAAWLYGEVHDRPFDRTKGVALAAALIALGVGGWHGLGDVQATPPGEEMVAEKELADGGENGDVAESELQWIDWSETIVEEKLEEGRPVFVNFTADWCITCKTNERETIDTPEVIETVHETDVAMIKADLTHTDDRLVEELEEFGRTGVPLYLMYDPDHPEAPEMLPEILSQNRILEAIEEAS